MTAISCESCRALAAELALGIASGDERAAALRHLTTCAACRDEVRTLTETADQLLLAAREVEPSAGFDQRVVASFGPQPARHWSRGARWTAVAAATLVALSIGALIGWLVSRPDPAEQQMAEAVEQMDGRSIRVATLGPAEEDSRVVVYDGDPSWLLVTVAGGVEDGEYEIVCEYEGGWSRSPGSVAVRDGRGAWAATIPRTLSDLDGVRLRGGDGQWAADASFG
jgi:hypothetical protein